jgi:O-antigen/teichoic acid export membrane protein
MTVEGSGARVARNTLLNALGTFGGVALALVVTPFIVHDLGQEAFGVWAFAWGLSFVGGYASLSDLGVEASAARAIALARGRQQPDVESEVASSACAFFIAAGLILGPLGAGLAFPLTDLLGVSGDLHGEAVACMALVFGQLVFELPARAFVAILDGAQRYGSFQIVEVSRSIALAVGITTTLITGAGLPGLGGSVMASSLVVLIVARTLARRAAPEAHVSPRHATRRTMRSLFSFGGRYFAFQSMYTFYRQVDKLIIGAALGPKPVGVYEIANRIGQGAEMVQSVSGSALVPATAYHVERRAILRDLYLRATSYSVAVSVPIAAAGFILAPDLIRSWVGSEMLGATDSARIFLAYIALIAFNRVGLYMLVGIGDMGFLVRTMGVFLAINVVLSIALVNPVGIEGVVIASAVGQAIVWVPYLRHYLQLFEVSLGEWTRHIVVPLLPALAVQAITAPVFIALGHGTDNLALVGLLTLASAALGAAAVILVGLRGERRRELMQILGEALGRRPAPTSG